MVAKLSVVTAPSAATKPRAKPRAPQPPTKGDLCSLTEAGDRIAKEVGGNSHSLRMRISKAVAAGKLKTYGTRAARWGGTASKLVSLKEAEAFIRGSSRALNSKAAAPPATPAKPTKPAKSAPAELWTIKQAAQALGCTYQAIYWRAVRSKTLKSYRHPDRAGLHVSVEEVKAWAAGTRPTPPPGFTAAPVRAVRADIEELKLGKEQPATKRAIALLRDLRSCLASIDCEEMTLQVRDGTVVMGFRKTKTIKL